jgi:A/G-specific adenine glycosylase
MRLQAARNGFVNQIVVPAKPQPDHELAARIWLMNKGQTPTDRSDIPDDLRQIQDALLTWFRTNQRDLPWRRTREPYCILVSEVMLQQTQVDRVIPKYHEFLERFPTVRDLADAPTAEVIRIWSGLGYNRRAVNLQRATQAVIEQHGGEFPNDVDALKALPGIGPYTAGAIACFAFEQDVGFFDTNIRRVLHRLFAGPEVPEESRSTRELQDLASAIVPTGNGWEWNQALMEFGAIQCTARKPACLTCPLQRHCRAFPEIQSVLASLAKTGFRRKNEAAFHGSNRFYRGRVVRVLQAVGDGEGLSLDTLGPQVHDDFGAEHVAWLSEVIEGLRRDGLVEVAEESPAYDVESGRGPRVRLPGGGASN